MISLQIYFLSARKLGFMIFFLFKFYSILVYFLYSQIMIILQQLHNYSLFIYSYFYTKLISISTHPLQSPSIQIKHLYYILLIFMSMDIPLYELDEPFQCTCFDSKQYSRQLQSPSALLSLEKDNDQKSKRTTKSHEGKLEKNINNPNRSHRQKTSLRRGRALMANDEKGSFSEKNNSESGDAQICEEGKLTNNANKINWGSFGHPLEFRNNHKKNNSMVFEKFQQQRQEKRKLSYYRQPLNPQSFKPTPLTSQFNCISQKQIATIHPSNHTQKKIFPQKSTTKNIEANKYKPSQQNNFSFLHKLRTVTPQSAHPTNLNLNKNQIALKKQENISSNQESGRQSNVHSSKISLTHRDSQFSQGNKFKGSHQNSHRSSKGGYQHEQFMQNTQSGPRVQSFRMYMKEIESVVDENEFDDQMSEVIGRGWEINREEQFLQQGNCRQMKTLPTLASNIKNSGTTNSIFGLNSNHSKKI